MKKIRTMIIIIGIFIFNGCDNHPKDKTHIDDIIHCGFGKEYVSGYIKSNGHKVDGYCRNSN